MRGKLLGGLEDEMLLRLIPAHAGKTVGAVSVEEGEEAHPRACGENVSGLSLVEGRAGSSPRMRGKPLE